jgi:COP9 signalosome complex subunit 4
MMQVYDNVSFEALGSLLNMDADGAEGTARRSVKHPPFLSQRC